MFFTSVFNLTVTQGWISGFVFYANIVWLYQNIFFPHQLETNTVLKFLIAWVNLDFGIEICFSSGLTAFWKTWLQFISPLYIWAIAAGLINVATRYSTRLTNLLGSRAVPVLNTLFLLRFFPLILLFWAGLATVLLLYVVSLYTTFVSIMQWLCRVSQLQFLKWIMQFRILSMMLTLLPSSIGINGVLLLIRGILPVIFAIHQRATSPRICTNIILYYMCLVHPYNNSGILVLESSFILNLLVFCGFHFFTHTLENGQSTKQAVTVGLSTGAAFLQFCGIMLMPIIMLMPKG